MRPFCMRSIFHEIVAGMFMTLYILNIGIYIHEDNLFTLGLLVLQTILLFGTLWYALNKRHDTFHADSEVEE